MTRDDGWRMLIIGRRIERLTFLARMMSGFLRMEAAKAPGAMEWLLELADSIITYRSRYSRLPELLPVIDLLVFDDSNPHSVMFQGWALVRYLNRLLRDLGDERGDKVTEAIVKLVAFPLERLEHHPIAQHQACLELADLLSELEHAANQLSDWLGNRYFTHVGDVSRQTMAV